MTRHCCGHLAYEVKAKNLEEEKVIVRKNHKPPLNVLGALADDDKVMAERQAATPMFHLHSSTFMFPRNNR